MAKSPESAKRVYRNSLRKLFNKANLVKKAVGYQRDSQQTYQDQHSHCNQQRFESAPQHYFFPLAGIPCQILQLFLCTQI